MICLTNSLPAKQFGVALILSPAVTISSVDLRISETALTAS
jgi:hypothetical protein